MARPTMLTRARHERIITLLRDGFPFATACRAVGVSASAGYEWLYRGWGTHPDRPPTAVYVAFARAVDAVFPGGFAARHEDEFVEAQSNDGTESGRDRENGGETVVRSFAELAGNGSETARIAPGTSRHVQAHEAFAEPENRWETGEAAAFSEFPESGEGFAEVTEPGKSDTQRDRARAREENGDTEPRHAPMPWLSQRSRERSILDIEF
jgi:hypothetical protein